jgi:flagella basal body P-ring formation protein FlgA
MKSAMLAGLLLSAAPVSAATQSLDSIRSAAESFVRQQMPEPDAKSGVKYITTAGALDSRLRLESCASSLRASLPPGARVQARTTVGIACAAGAQWTIYVPVALETELPVLVLKQPALRDAHLGVEAIEVRRQRMPGSDALYISDPANLQGRHLKRSAPIGTILTADLMAPDILVKRGQQVTLLTAGTGIEVRANGKALTEGGVQDRIRVQNLSSMKIIEGTVEAADIVRVGG